MKIFFRMYQFVLKYVSKCLPWKTPYVIEGTDALKHLSDVLASRSETRYIIVTDEGMVKAGLVIKLLDALSTSQHTYHIYDQIKPNPTIDSIEKAYLFYIEHSCEAIIGFGGGSPIDAAKALGVKIVRPKVSLKKFKGILKVRKRLPFLVAIPTTAGTGTETTIASVITDSKTHEKYAIMDMNLMPDVAVLDPTLLVGLPAFFTATTGMDALTHAVEAFIGRSHTKHTRKASLDAILGVYTHLEYSYLNPSDLNARMAMLKASFEAGYAFTRAYVGNIHAIAHTFGGYYDIPHGYANAIIMPHVLSFYGKKVHHKLALIYDYLQMGDVALSIEHKAAQVIEWITQLNQKLHIPTHIQLKDKTHIKNMAYRAYKEANPLYPVPTIFSVQAFEMLIDMISVVKS